METKGLGIRQKMVIDYLKNGAVIQHYTDFNKHEQEFVIQDEDGSNIYRGIDVNLFQSLIKRELLVDTGVKEPSQGIFINNWKLRQNP